MASVSSRASATSRPTFSAQPPTMSMPSASRGRVEAHLDLHRIEDRREDVAAAELVLAVGLFLLGDLPAIQLEARQLLGGTGDDDRTPAVADGQHRRQHGADILRELVEQPAMRSGSALVTDTIGGRSPSTEIPRRRATSVPAAPISWANASSSTSRAPAALSASTASTPCECPATATGGVAFRSMPCRASARTAAIWVSSTPGIDTAADVRCLSDGTGSSAASARTQCSGSKPIGRTTTSSFATGSSSSSTSPTSVARSDSIPADETSSSRVSSQALPWPPNATAYGSPAVRRSTRAWVSRYRVRAYCRSRSADTRWLRRGAPVVLVDRHLLCLPCMRLYVSVRSARSPPVAGSGRFRSIPRRITAGETADRCVVGGPPGWLERRGGLHRLY